MLSLDTAYRSFGGKVEASSTPTICRLSDSRRHQLLAIVRAYSGDHSVVVVLRPLTNRGGMNQVHQLANALLTVVFCRRDAPGGASVYRKNVYENSDNQPCFSGIRAMDEPPVETHFG